MRILKKVIDKDGRGEVVMIPEDAEDIFHIYNLITNADHVACKSFRKVVKESATGSVKSDRVAVYLEISVEKVEFEPANLTLRVGGKVTNENRMVKKGVYHTLEIEPPRKFTLIKDHWDSISLQVLEESANPARTADLAAIVMDNGIASVCLITRTMTIVKQKIEVSIPKTRAGSSKHDKSTVKFYNYILQAILTHINFQVIKAVVIASPGFVKDSFYKWLLEEAQRRDLKDILEHKSQFLLCRCSSGFKHSLKEVLADPAVKEKLKNVKASSDGVLLDRFNEVFNTDPDRALYGWEHVKFAADNQAIDVLLVTDELFRVFDAKERKKYVDLVEGVRENGGKAAIFSTMHPSGEQLKLMTGLACITRYPLNIDHLNADTTESSED